MGRPYTRSNLILVNTNLKNNLSEGVNRPNIKDEAMIFSGNQRSGLEGVVFKDHSASGDSQ